MAIEHTLNFITLLLISFIIPIGLFIEYVFNMQVELGVFEKRYGIKSIVFTFFCAIIVRWRLKPYLLLKKRMKLGLKEEEELTYSKKVYFLFLLPFLIVFVIPIVFGYLNGSLRFLW